MANPLEEYLNQFRSHLKNLPASERDAEVEEVRQHLQALVQQRIEEGDPEEVAAVHAISQFGSSQENAVALRSVWERSETGKAKRFLRASHSLFAVVTICSAVWNLLWAICLWTGHYYWMMGVIYPLPNLFSGWVPLSKFDDILSLAMSTTFFGAFALLSLRYPPEMRTTFFGVFAALIATNIVTSLPWDWAYIKVWNFNPPEYPDHRLAMYIAYPLKVTVCIWSSLYFVSALIRDKSLISQPRRLV